RPSLEVRHEADPDRVFRGESTDVTVSVTNSSRVFGANLVARDRVGGSARVPVPLIRLRSGRTARVAYPVPTRRRGLVEIGPLEASRRDPLGLVAVLRRYGDRVTVRV